MKNDTDTTANIKGGRAASTNRGPRRRDVSPPTNIRTNELAIRAWQIEQEEIDQKRAAAWREYPPGSKLFVTTARGIPRRGRSGLVFTTDTRLEVEVVDLDDEQIAEIKSAKILYEGDLEKAADKAGVSKDEAIAVRSGNAVSPMGAKAIAEDDGLSVFKGPGDRAKAERDEELETAKAELAKANAELAKFRKGRESNPNAPERLGKGTKATEIGTFGDDDKAKT